MYGETDRRFQEFKSDPYVVCKNATYEVNSGPI